MDEVKELAGGGVMGAVLGVALAKLPDVLNYFRGERKEQREERKGDLALLRDYMQQEIDQLRERVEKRDCELEECRRDRAELHGKCSWLENQVRALMERAGLAQVGSGTPMVSEAGD